MAVTSLDDVAAVERKLDEAFTREYGLALGCRADFARSLGEDRYFLLEVEMGQTHPQTNVLKYWPWLEENDRRRAHVVQVSYGNTRRRRLTEWLAGRLADAVPGRLTYERFDAPLDQDDIARIVAIARSTDRV